MMKKKTILTLASGAAILTLLGVVISANPRYFDMTKAANAVQSCGTIEFGEGTTGDSGKVLTSSGYTTSSGLVVSLSEATKVYSAGAGNPARLGTTSAAATLTFSFDSMLVTSIRLYAYQYGSDGSATVTLKTSASTAQTATISTTTAPAEDSLSGDGIYLFAGLDGGSGTSSTSLTISSDGNNRFYLAKILLTINGSSAVTSSTATSSSAVTSSAEASSSGTTSTFPVLSSYDYRIAPNYSSSATSMPIYNVASVSGAYQAQIVMTITKATDCLTAEQVAEYYVSFRALPPNYFSSTSAALNYGKNGRVVSTYTSGATHTYDYTVKLGTWNVTSGGTYYEFDIDLTGSYNTGSSISRGSGRVVAIVDGITDYGSDPVCYFTEDHYADFKEYYNFYQGWSPLFAGVYNKSGSYENSPTTTLERPSVPTVTYTIV